ncbi:MAG TPA: succinate dehydrogenase hydrophobic membrane anchor subunit [Actinomycetota bacterium]|nr:succinate dehydrogenase hydrophobic membrane anchor subunit [Actinomycetota bacterium]
MATTTDAHPVAPAPGARPPGHGRDRPVRGFELWTWLFMRLSGIALLVLAVGHVLIMHVLDEGVDRVDFAFIQLRWASLFWKSWDWLMLVLALLHGVNGLRVIVLDYVRPAGVRLAINSFFTVLGAALMVLGTIVVVTFDPADWPA